MLSTQAKSLARLDRANDTPRLAEPLSVEAHRAASTAAKTLARLDRANDFPIWRAEQLKAEALLLRCKALWLSLKLHNAFQAPSKRDLAQM